MKSKLFGVVALIGVALAASPKAQADIIINFDDPFSGTFINILFGSGGMESFDMTLAPHGGTLVPTPTHYTLADLSISSPAIGSGVPSGTGYLDFGSGLDGYSMAAAIYLGPDWMTGVADPGDGSSSRVQIVPPRDDIAYGEFYSGPMTGSTVTEIVTVPEPGSVGVLASGLALFGLLGVRRRRS